MNKLITHENNFVSKLFRISLLSLCGMFFASALNAQNITMQLKHGTVQQAIELLQKNYNYSVVMKTQDVELNKPISIDIRKETVNTVIEKIFAGQNVSFTVNGKNIIVSKKESGNGKKPLQEPISLINLTGKVMDSTGEPLTGATVTARNTKQGEILNVVIVDMDGNYKMQVPENAWMDVSFLGYEPVSAPVNKRTNINFRLQDDDKLLDEVIVIGYGVQRKNDLTGSVAQVNMSSYEGQQSISIADYLRGTIAGLNIARSASVRGQSTMSIRGQTSLGASEEPLIVVDGMIFKGMLNDINPNDIETISVMKDASSVAVYGASGAAGVILITTKQGKTEKPSIRFDVKTSVSKLLRRQEVYNTAEYLKMRGDKLITDETPGTFPLDYFNSPYTLKNIDLSTWMNYQNVAPTTDPTAVWLQRLKLSPTEIDNYYNHRSIDWLDEVFQEGVMQDYNLGVSGKSKNLNYYWSLGYMDNKGAVVGEQYKNIRSHINIVNDITDFLQVGIRGNLSSTNSDEQAVVWSQAFDNSPLGSLYNPDGTYNRYPNEDNMIRNPLDQTQFDVTDKNLNLIGVVFAKIKLPFGFQAESNYNNRWRFKQGYTYKPSWTIDGMRDLGVAQREEYKQYDWNMENLLRWNKTFNQDHKFDLVLMQSAEKRMFYTTTAGATSFTTTELLGYHNLGMGDIKTSSSNDEEETKASYMARLNYSLMDRYLLTLSIRRDGYSAFGQDKPWADFPAAALAWRISEEEFMRNLHWLNNLKLRLSYGKNGNSNIGRYDALATLSNGYYISNGASAVTLYPSRMGNRLLQWEETLATNAGLDINLFKNKLNFTVDAYQMETTNQLLSRKLPTLTGFSSVMANLGQINNTGLEVTVNSVNVENSFLRWTSDVVFSMNRNTIKHLYGEMVDVPDEDGNITGQQEADDPTNGWFINHAIDEIWDYKITGIWQESERAEALTRGRYPGDYKTYVLPATTGTPTSVDKQFQGFTRPRYRISMRNSFSLRKVLDISFLLRSELGHKKANNELNTGSYAHRGSQMKYPYWTYDNPSDYWGRLGASRTGTIYRNASFLRVENIVIGYALPQKWIGKASIQKASVYFNMDNIYCFDNWLYWDPETKAPTPATFTFGLSLTL